MKNKKKIKNAKILKKEKLASTTKRIRANQSATIPPEIICFFHIFRSNKSQSIRSNLPHKGDEITQQSFIKNIKKMYQVKPRC